MVPQSTCDNNMILETRRSFTGAPRTAPPLLSDNVKIHQFFFMVSCVIPARSARALTTTSTRRRVSATTRRPSVTCSTPRASARTTGRSTAVSKRSPVADPGGPGARPPLAPKIFFNHAVFIPLRGKTPILSKIWSQGAPPGSKLCWPP